MPNEQITYDGNLLYITDYDSRKVSILDSITNDLVTTIPLNDIVSVKCLSPADEVRLLIKTIKILAEIGLISKGICYSSNIILYKALKQIEKGNNEAAIELLEQFINELIGFDNSGFLSNIIAIALIWIAEDIISKLEP